MAAGAGAGAGAGADRSRLTFYTELGNSGSCSELKDLLQQPQSSPSQSSPRAPSVFQVDTLSYILNVLGNLFRVEGPSLVGRACALREITPAYGGYTPREGDSSVVGFVSPVPPNLNPFK